MMKADDVFSILISKINHGSSGGSGGTTNYDQLNNKPKINGVELTGNKTSYDLNIIGGGAPLIYGFRINDSESDPYKKVTYLADAVGMTPAHMDFENGIFDYGSWENVWFVRDCKPCILNSDGTVRTYLNKDDYTKDVDGNNVDITSNLSGANVMIEFPKIWYKVVPDASDEYSGSVFVSPVRADADFKDYSYIDENGNHKEHFYMSAYVGCTVINNVLRSVSGVSSTSNISISNFIQYAKNNAQEYTIDNFARAMLIEFLLVLMSKTVDSQSAFGIGCPPTGSNVSGTLDKIGFFYGSSENVTTPVKIFGIENYYGVTRFMLGAINDSGTYKIKFCTTREDGTNADNWNYAGDGYISLVKITSSGYKSGMITKMKFSHDCMFPAAITERSDYYNEGYYDFMWVNDTNQKSIIGISGGLSGKNAISSGIFTKYGGGGFDPQTAASNWFASLCYC